MGMPLCLAILVAPAAGACYLSTARGDDASDASAEDARLDDGADAPADGPDGCEPRDPSGVSVEFEVNGTSTGAAAIDTPCSVTSVVGEEVGHTVVTLLCGTGAAMVTHSLDLRTTPAVSTGLWPGLDVYFRYVAEPIWWTNRWFVIRDASGALMLAGVEAAAINPTGVRAADWYRPVGVSVAGGVCPATTDRCGPLERQAIDVSFAGDRRLVLDGRTAAIGDVRGVTALVGHATHYSRMDCDDVPDQFYTALFVMAPEG